MTDSVDAKQWLVFGWPLDHEAHLRREVDARLYEPADDGTYTVTDGTIPLDTVGLERIDDFEIVPGVLALHQAPPAHRAEFLENIPTDNPQQSTTGNPKSLLNQVKHHSPWSFSDFTLHLSRIQHASLETGASQTYRSQRVMTDWETAREICYRTGTYFGLHVLRDATIIHEPDSPDLHHQTLRITFESPVDGPSMLHGTIERDVEGVITLRLWYRFTTPGSWHQFCARDLDTVGEIRVLELMRAVITELIAFAEHGLTRDEMISHLGRVHDLGDGSAWSQSQLAATNAVEDQAESSLPKIRRMLLE